MSLLFEKQSLAVLAVAHGAVVSIRDNFDLGLEFNLLLSKANNHLARAGKEWPLDAKENARAMPWVRERLEHWARENPKVDDGWRIIALGAMAVTAITDRYEASAEKLRKVRTDAEVQHYQKQVDLLDPIFPALEALVDYLRKSGPENSVLAETDELLRKLYKILEVSQ